MEAKKERGQFYCDVCDCELKDSANYLDHINGKRHNRNKGINLKEFTDSTLEEVRAMLQKKRMERDERLSNENKASDTTRDIPGQHEEDEEEEDEDDVDDDDDDEDEPDDDDENHEEEDA